MCKNDIYTGGAGLNYCTFTYDDVVRREGAAQTPKIFNNFIFSDSSPIIYISNPLLSHFNFPKYYVTIYGMGQKLSAQAKRDKAARDLAFAKTPARRAKKAHAQRMARKHPRASQGMDYDHKDQRYETPQRNRGNDGQGTKKESGNRYST